MALAGGAAVCSGAGTTGMMYGGIVEGGTFGGDDGTPGVVEGVAFGGVDVGVFGVVDGGTSGEAFGVVGDETLGSVVGGTPGSNDCAKS
jgi:hypothetical protein